jgi:hypothetical protein
VVTETLVKKYNATGDMSSTERRVTETETFPNGASNQSIHVYTSDINGVLKEMERREIQERVQGNSRTTETTVERPNLSGSFQTSEKRTAKSDTSGNRTDTTETVYRRSQNGDLYTALQQVKVVTRTNKNSVSEQIADYEPSVVTGSLQLARQTLSTTTTDAAGNETKEVNLYASAVDGRVQEPGAPQQIKEQQLITRHPAADGKVTETLTVRRPSLADPGRLGSPQVISETVCSGNCK